MTNRTVVVGDVGGTHSRWAIFDGALGSVSVQRTADTRTATEALNQFLGENPCTPDAVCLGVAGPVVKGTASLTNVEWTASEFEIPWPTKILNDLEAVAYALPSLNTSDVSFVGGHLVQGRQLVLGVGTGFGGAIYDNPGVIPMEPGHEPLVAFDDESEEFLHQLKRIVEHPTVEDVVSGRGFEMVLRMRAIDPGGMAAGRLVMDGWESSVELAWIRRHFLRFFGHTVGRMAAQLQATGGVFLTGGVVGHWSRHLSSELFMDSMRKSCARFGELDCPAVQIIRHEFAALLGAGTVGQTLIEQ
ncbi:MAG: glucokinase [Myxococcota bacterium]